MDSIDSTMTPITDRKIETSGYDMQRQALENKCVEMILDEGTNTRAGAESYCADYYRNK